MDTDNQPIEPPKTVGGILCNLGPGLIVAGAIVGSGELIATTAVGAEAGFWLLWLIIIGCVIKVFVQVELGRYVIVNGKTTLTALTEVPGPRAGKFNWLILFWAISFVVSVGQLGGIVGGVGQALSISVPLTTAGKDYNNALSEKNRIVIAIHEREHSLTQDPVENAPAKPSVAELESAYQTVVGQPFRLPSEGPTGPTKISDLKRFAHDHYYWAFLVTVMTAIVLAIGRYQLVENVATTLVALFTLVTILNVVFLQTHEAWALSWKDITDGLTLQLPPKTPDTYPLATALMAFGIIGVGAGELVFYPYWCLEKGYARFIGPNDHSEAWLNRAEGWLKVLRWDAWCSMIVYTISTVAFYLLGAAVLNRIHLNPSGTEMISTLAAMYEPVFGDWGQAILLFGAFAVLYSTFFVTNASKARLTSDALKVFGLRANNPRSDRVWLTTLSVAYPIACFGVYYIYSQPKKLVLAAGFTQALLLPMLSFAAIYFRYRKMEPRLAPGKLWDALLWISAIGMLIAGGWLALTRVFPQIKELG